jgi:transcriptional regulator GlxA family with amidase domain
MTHRVVIVVYPGFELLDATGPASVFAAANEMRRNMGAPPFYAVQMASASGGNVTSNVGVAVGTRALARVASTRVDTLLIAGAFDGESLQAAAAEPALRPWATRCARSADRYGSVCTGAYVLAALGLVDGRRVATHWAACAAIGELYPAVAIDPDSIYVADGKVWTSAGGSAGIDMALAMVGSDLGPSVAAQAAQWMVLYARRPGFQSQFSPIARAQAKADSPFAELIGWLQDNLHRSLTVPVLAARAGLSERSFHRRFLAATGETPARFIETARLEAARTLLSQPHSLKVIAAQVGLSPTARFSAIFARRFGVTPLVFRELHAVR